MNATVLRPAAQRHRRGQYNKATTDGAPSHLPAASLVFPAAHAPLPFAKSKLCAAQ